MFVDNNLSCDHSDESYGVVNYIDKVVLNFLFCPHTILSMTIEMKALEQSIPEKHFSI